MLRDIMSHSHLKLTEYYWGSYDVGDARRFSLEHRRRERMQRKMHFVFCLRDCSLYRRTQDQGRLECDADNNKYIYVLASSGYDQTYRTALLNIEYSVSGGVF